MPSIPLQMAVTTSILEGLPLMFEAFSSRMVYLYCKASVYRGARVGFHTEISTHSLTPASSTRAQGPISAVNITKSIMEYVRWSLHPSRAY